MGRYTDAQQDIFSVFATNEWKNEGIATHPSLIVPDNPGQEFIRISVVPSDTGINTKSLSGLLMIDIFAAKVKGPKRPMEIADVLDRHLNSKSVQLSSGTTQFMSSNTGRPTQDKDDPALSMTLYSIAFNYFGER